MKHALRVSGLLFFILTSICYSTAIWGQPVFYIEDQTIETGKTTEIAVQVTDFTDIIGLQFTLRWDSTKLDFSGFQEFSLGMSADNFGATNTSGGILIMSFIDMNLTGVSLENDAVLFSMLFSPVGDANDVTSLMFSNEPAVQEVTDVDQETLDATFEDGEISIMGPTSTYAPNGNPLQVSEIYPNPFQDQTQLRWHQENAGQVGWELRNELGQLISSGTGHYSAGEHQLVLGRKELKQAGTYFIQLRQENYTITEKLVYIEP